MTASIVGNIEANDDYNHEVGPEPNFNESVYFNLFDASEGIGGFIRMGNRANEGRGEMTVCLFSTRRDRLFFRFDRPEVTSNARFDGGGLNIEVVEPGEHVVMTFGGKAFELARPADMADPGQAFRTNPEVDVAFELHHRAAGPLYGHREGAPIVPAAGVPPQLYDRDPQMGAASHFEQHMEVDGWVKLGDEKIPISGLGLRDHSWGPRTWQDILPYLWLTCDFSPGIGLTALAIWQPDGSGARPGGMVCREGRVEAVTAVSVEASYSDPERLLISAYEARLGLASGEHIDLSAKVLGVVPLRNRRGGRTAHLGEALTRFAWGERVGFGMTEYLQQGSDSPE